MQVPNKTASIWPAAGLPPHLAILRHASLLALAQTPKPKAGCQVGCSPQAAMATAMSVHEAAED